MKAESIFRFVSIRPPQPAKDDATVYDREVADEIGREIDTKATDRIARKDAWHKVGEEILSSPRYFRSSEAWRKLFSDWSMYAPLMTSAMANGGREAFRRETESLLRKLGGEDIDLRRFLESQSFGSLRRTLWTSYYGNILSPRTRPGDREELVRWIRFFYLLEASTDETRFKRAIENLSRLRPAVPDHFFRMSAPSIPVTERGVAQGKDPSHEIREKLTRFRSAYDEVTYRLNSDVHRLHATAVADHPEMHVALVRGVRREPNEAEVPTGAGTLAIDGLAHAPWRRSLADLDVSTEVRSAVRDVGVQSESSTALEVLDRLERAITFLESNLVDAQRKDEVVAIGSTLSGVHRREALPLHIEPLEPVGTAAAMISTGISPLVGPTGVGDLKVTKQRAARYEAGEIAHIENVLAKEKRNRQHRRLRQIEELITEEREREEENVRDLQSTERFEIQTEIEKTIKSETSLEAGLDLSAGYGPVSLSIYADFATSESKEESDRTATTYAKELTEKTLARLVERVREERKVRTLEEVEEKNEHGFDNTESGDHVTGVYRWVDKYYRAKVVDYGKRLFYDFVIPEPAVGYIFGAKHNYGRGVLPIKPMPPSVGTSGQALAPNEITRTNYLALAKQYGADGIEPPPPGGMIVSKVISRENPSAGIFTWANEDLEIPEGYGPISGGYLLNCNAGWATWMYFHIGMNYVFLNNQTNSAHFPPSLVFDGVPRARITIGGVSYGSAGFALTVEIYCSLQSEAFARWQLRTYTAIMAAYRKALMDYEERVAAAQIQGGLRFGGSNPGLNRDIEREQLKFGCLAIWSNWAAFDLSSPVLDVYSPLPHSYPQILPFPATANAERIRFFEEAFEWTNMTYEIYPYFWGRQEKWLDAMGIQNTDPLFEKFLRAGAARVRVPVRPSYTEAVLYYQMTGEIWPGGSVPAFSSLTHPDAPLYNSYLQDMADVEDMVDLGDEVSIDKSDPDTWLIKLPTTLVWLQESSELPDFESN